MNWRNDCLLRQKPEWAGLTKADAFRAELGYGLRIEAQRAFYSEVKSGQAAAVLEDPQRFTPKTKAQVAPLLMQRFPRGPAAMAAIGLSAVVEYKAHFPINLLASPVTLAAAWKDRDSAAVQKAGAVLAEVIENRLVLADLEKRVPPVRFYRCFLASLQTTMFRSLREISQAAVIFGDLLVVREEQLHPTTAMLLQTLRRKCLAFEKELRGESYDVLQVGRAWFATLMPVVAEVLPAADSCETAIVVMRPSEPGGSPASLVAYSCDASSLPPLERPQAPLLDDIPPGILAADAVLKQVSESVNKTVARDSWWDRASAILEFELEKNGFKAGPIEGTPDEGEFVNGRLGNHKAEGVVFSRNLQPSEDELKVDALYREAHALSRRLSRLMATGSRDQLVARDYLSSGTTFNSNQLALHEVTETPFRSWRRMRLTQDHGNTTLIIVVDASSSMSGPPLATAQRLAATFLLAPAGDVAVYAAAYSQGGNPSKVRVDWMAHPRRTAARNRREAVAAVASLPNNGLGGQADALSLLHILRETKIQDEPAHLVLITDTAYVKSFPAISLQPEREVEAVFQDFRKSGNAQVTLVSLGRKPAYTTGADHLITITPSELVDPMQAAGRIAQHVAKLLRSVQP